MLVADYYEFIKHCLKRLKPLEHNQATELIFRLSQELPQDR